MEHAAEAEGGDKGPTPRERFHEERKANQAKKRTPHERLNRVKKDAKARRQRTELDHCPGELVVEKFDTKTQFECWRCDEPKASRVLYKWHVVQDADEQDAGSEPQEGREDEVLGADGTETTSDTGADDTEGSEEVNQEEEVADEARPTPSPAAKTICLGCYGHLLSLRKARDAQAVATKTGQQQVGAGVGEASAPSVEAEDKAPTRLAPYPHKRREKMHARVSYVVPKGMRGGRGRGRGSGQQPQPGNTTASS